MSALSRKKALHASAGEPKANDGEAVEYLRVLDDTELMAMTVHLDMRMNVLAGQLMRRNPPIALPVEQIANHYVVGLLENLLGPDQTMRVREWHAMWLDRTIDKAEAGIRTDELRSVLE